MSGLDDLPPDVESVGVIISGRESTPQEVLEMIKYQFDTMDSDEFIVEVLITFAWK